MSRNRMSLPVVALLTLSCLFTGAAPAMAADVCGGNATDYTGTGGTIVPFKGKAGDREMTVTSTQTGGISLKTEINIDGDIRSATGALLIKTDTTGNGEIWFPVYKGTAHGTVECTGTSKPTRVTTITGMTPVADDTKTVKFTVTRAGI